MSAEIFDGSSSAQGERRDLRVFIQTLGCAKNEVDSQMMADSIRRSGMTLVEHCQEAEVIIVNTCSFIQSATEESLEVIFDLLGLDTVMAGKAKLIVAGCMPARYGDDLAESLTEVDTFVPCSHEDDVVEIICQLFPDFIPHTPDTDEVPEILEGVSAYVKISDGCNRFCSFCTIPYIRGRYHSYDYQTIRESVQRAIERGAKEIVLIAQDTGRWGDDFKNPLSLAWLMDMLAYDFPETWFRVMYIQPEGITNELLNVVADHDNICSYFDVPIQHVNPDILKAMNRKGSAESYREMLARIRTLVPGAIVRTTVIAGFPGETEEAFCELKDFLEDVEFDYVGVFPYSPEDLARSSKFPDQIDEDIRVERARELRELADTISSARIAGLVGTRAEVLVLGCEEDGQLYGRTYAQAPEVDGVVFVDAGEPGELVPVRIVDTLLYEMEGERL